MKLSLVFGRKKGRVDCDNEEVENVEIVLSHRPSKRLSFRSSRRASKRGSFRRATRRRSSLTIEEEHVLLSLSKHSAITLSQDFTTASSISPSLERRASLRASINSRTAELTISEEAFLNDLADSEFVSERTLERCEEVLSTDPLFLVESVPFLQHDGEAESPPLPECQEEEELDTSFRKETWDRYLSNPVSSSNDSIDQDDQKDSIEEQDQATCSPREISWMDKMLCADLNSDLMKDADLVKSFSEAYEHVILGTSAYDETCLPHVLSPPIMDALRPHMPYAVQEDNFWLKYSTNRDGRSMRSLLHKCRNSARTIVAIETFDGDVFGSFTSSPWQNRGLSFYGSAEAFIWRLKKPRTSPTLNVDQQIELESDVEVFPWSTKNRNIQSLANMNAQIVLGGGGPDEATLEERQCNYGSALAIQPCLSRGLSNHCVTFGSPIIPTSGREVFEIANIEVWTMTPVDTLTQAEQLELSRRFVFDHGNFVDH